MDAGDVVPFQRDLHVDNGANIDHKINGADADTAFIVFDVESCCVSIAPSLDTPDYGHHTGIDDGWW